MTSPARNDPCPCGSGRKFKHCCLQTNASVDAARIRLRNAEGTVVPMLFEYVERLLDDEFFEEAWDEFFLWDQVPDPAESPEMGTTFEPFFLFSFVADDAENELPEEWPREPVAPHFLRHEGEYCEAFHREFIEKTLRSQRASLRSNRLCRAAPSISRTF